MNTPKIQIRERNPSFVKERLFVAGGTILIIVSIILLFFNILIADIVYLAGAIVSVIFTLKQYRLLKEQHMISKAGVIWQSIITGIFVIIGFFVILIVNFFWLVS